MQECKTGKWCRVVFNVSACLLTSHPILNVIFTFAPLGVVLRMYEDIKWNNVISNLKQFFRLICRHYILISYVDCTDEPRQLMLKVYNKKVIECIL